MKKSAVLIAITLMVGATGAQAAEATYHFGSAHQRTNITFANTQR